MQEEISLQRLFEPIRKNIRLIIAIEIVVTVFTVICAYFIPNKYITIATFVTVSSPNTGATGISQLLMSSLAPRSSGGGGDQGYMTSVMESRSFARQVSKSLNLANSPKIFSSEQLEKMSDREREDATVSILKSSAKVVTDPFLSGLIKLRIETPYQGIAADVANAYIVEFQNYQSANSMTSAKRMRRFIEYNLAKKKEEMLQLTKSTSQFYRNNRVSPVDSLVTVPIAKVEKREIKPFDSLKEYQEYFHNLQIDDKSLDKSGIMSVEGVSADDYLKYLSMERNVLEQTVMLLSQQLESSKVDEAKEELKIQVIDEALPPLKPSSPNRARIIVLQMFATFIAASALVVARNFRKL